MLNISYTFSPFLLRSYEKINNLRREIVLYPLSPKTELEFRFRATINRIHYGLHLAGTEVSSEQIKKILSSQVYLAMQTGKKNTENNSIERQVIRYKHAFDYLKQEWLVTPAPIDVETIITLHEIASEGKLKVSPKQISEVLNYLQATSDSPFIQAAIAKFLFTYMDPFSGENEVISLLCSYLFLYKAGWDIRGMVVLEHALGKEPEQYKSQYHQAVQSLNVTGWIEYFVRVMTEQLEELHASMMASSAEGLVVQKDKSWELNDRQKAILNLLDDPTVMVTNRTIQKMFKVSQITASRDLAKLTTLGLLFAHGKGRSVRYTKV